MPCIHRGCSPLFAGLHSKSRPNTEGAPSEWGRQLLIDNGVDPLKIFTVVEGIDARGTYDPAGFDRVRSRRDVYGVLVLNIRLIFRR
jgi:hypothetical protein